MERYVLLKFDNEVIYKKTNLNVNDIKYEFNKEFPKSKYFVINDSSLIQIINNENKKFGKYNRLDINVGLYYLWINYFEFYKKLIESTTDFNEYNLGAYNEHFEGLKYRVSKPIIIDNWKTKLYFRDIENCVGIDPTHNQKYLNWLCKFVYNNSFNFIEDSNKLSQLLFDFDQPQIKSLIKKAGYSIDINHYDNDKDLFKIVKECYYDVLDEIQTKDKQILYEKRKVYEDIKWLVVVPENHEEAVTLGRGTYWCTSADSEDGERQFKNYTRKNKKLFIFIDKIDNDNKYQWSELQEDFLDQNDADFEIENVFSLNFIESYYNEVKIIPFSFKKILAYEIEDKEKYKHFYFETLSYADKQDYIDADKYLEYFINDPNANIRELLVKKGLYLNIFVNDPDWSVRKEVAFQNYKLGILINDENLEVRRAVAYQEYGLNKLINDNEYKVRRAVAGSGYGLDVLMYDENHLIRHTVVNHNYKLEYFLNDEDIDVKNYAYTKLALLKEKYGDNIPTEINKYGFECYVKY